MKKIFVFIVIIIVTLFWWWDGASVIMVSDFDGCVDARNPVMESYPSRCRHGDVTFIEEIGNELEKTELIRINTPRPRQVVHSPIIIKGEARGNWYFEGNFPVVLISLDGLIIAEGVATAQDTWMTEAFVPFDAELIFTLDANSFNNKGTLILYKDNPSGLPGYDDALEIPVFLE